MFYFLQGKKLSFEEINDALGSRDWLDQIENYHNDSLTEDKIEFFKHNYMEKNEMNLESLLEFTNFLYIRVFVEWMIVKALFSDYHKKEEELEHIIARMNEEKIDLQENEVYFRNLVSEISIQIYSINIRCSELEEKIENALKEKEIRDSIKQHLSNTIPLNSDISEVLTRVIDIEECSQIRMPLIIQIYLNIDEVSKRSHQNDSNEDLNELPKDFKLETCEENFIFNQISERFLEKNQTDKSDLKKTKSFDMNFKNKLEQELNKIKEDLLKTVAKNSKENEFKKNGKY